MKSRLLLIILVMSFLSCRSGKENSDLWPAVNKETRPWTRWWWMGNGVDRQNVASLIKNYSDAGFGGVEITPIYGAVGFEGQYLKYLSPSWMEMLRYSVAEAAENNMGVDMNLGTGWPFGGPQVTVPYAATRLIVQTWKMNRNTPFTDRIRVRDQRQADAGATLVALIAQYPDGSKEDITDRVNSDGILSWMPRNGECELVAGFCGKTLQKVKRAAPGGEGLVTDHLSADAVGQYLSRFDSVFSGTNQGVRCFFNDSYEVYGTDWTPELVDAFRKQHGYDLWPWLIELTDYKDSSETAHRIRYDYRQSVSALLLNNFTRKWSGWAHEKNALTRNQAHGSPANLIDLYAAVDIPECETFGSSFFPIPGLRRDSADIRNVDPDPVMMKFASSAANVTGKQLVSCETFTWLAEHFKVSLSQCKPEVDQVFLSGVNHVFYHGTTYSPEAAGWPGWLFYASVNFAPSNSFWPHLKGLNSYITRCQSLLQSGLPDNELLIYWPLPDYWMTTNSKVLMMAIHDIDRWLHPTSFYRMVKSLGNEGYSLDFISDNLLGNLGLSDRNLVTAAGARYKTLIFPAVRYLPETTFESAIKLAEKGALVVFENLPPDVPGYGNLEVRREQLKDLIQELHLSGSLPGILSAQVGKGKIIVTNNVSAYLKSMNVFPEPAAGSGVRFIRRKTTGGTYYFFVNHTPSTIDQFIRVNASAKSYYLLDPMNGNTGKALSQTENNQADVRIQLRSGESVFLFATDREFPDQAWKYFDYQAERIIIPGPWELRFTTGGPVLPEPRVLKQPDLWTMMEDSAVMNFSGSAVYKATFNLQGPLAPDYLLDPGKVCESAAVRINGMDAGIAWSIPFTLRVGKYLKQGRNSIEIEVANLMANRIRWMDRQKIEWRRYHEINFVNIDYKPFDASGWRTMPSGLQGPVTLQPLN